MAMSVRINKHIDIKLFSTLLLWAHTPVISWAVCLGEQVSSNPVRVQRERRKYSGLTPTDWAFKKTLSGLEPVPRYEPSTYQPIS